MKKSETVENIETNFNVNSMHYNGLSLWLEVRYRFFTKLFLGEESTLKIGNDTYLSIIKSLFYGFFNWFRKYDVWFLGSKNNRLEIDGKYYDRLFDYPASKMKRPLFIELTAGKHFKRKLVESKYIVSRSPLIIVEKVMGLFISLKKVDLSVMDQLNKSYNVDFDPTYAIKKMIAQYRVMSLLLKFTKPKTVFVAPSYTMYGYIKAFKEKGIKVVEIQHGVIQKEHYGYNIAAKFDAQYFPDLLLTLGNKEKEVFGPKNHTYSPEQIIPIGSFYIDHIKKSFAITKEMKNEKSNYERSFAVSLQELTIGEKLVPFLIDIAIENPTSVFFLKPRNLPKSYFESKFKLPKNIIISENVNVYELILSTDCHVSIYSTCALEAPALGKMNILVNIDNKAREIFEEVLNNETTTVYVNTKTGFQDYIDQMIVPDKELIEQAHSAIIFSGYTDNVDKLLSQIYDQ